MKPKNSRTRIPSPPAKRREPLPWQKPKPAAEDAGAPARLKAILSSASYRKADEDISFLDGDEARGPRLQLDYLKAEVRLTARGIKHTIVVFGSTRILEPIAAKRRVRALEKRFLTKEERQDTAGTPGNSKTHTGQKPFLRHRKGIRPPGEPVRRGMP